MEKTIDDIDFSKGDGLVPVIASGGCGKPDDILQIFKESNVDAALAASIFHYETQTVDRVKEFLKEHTVPVRL